MTNLCIVCNVQLYYSVTYLCIYLVSLITGNCVFLCICFLFWHLFKEYHIIAFMPMPVSIYLCVCIYFISSYQEHRLSSLNILLLFSEFITISCTIFSPHDQVGITRSQQICTVITDLLISTLSFI